MCTIPTPSQQTREASEFLQMKIPKKLELTCWKPALNIHPVYIYYISGFTSTKKKVVKSADWARLDQPP